MGLIDDYIGIAHKGCPAGSQGVQAYIFPDDAVLLFVGEGIKPP